MKHLKYLAGTSLLSLACIGLFVACGDTEGESCLLDTDCVAPDVCEAEVCTPTCTTDADCAVGEVCGARQNSTDGTMVCVAGAGNNTNNTSTGCSDQADPTGFCEAQNGEGAFCNEATDTCEGGANNVEPSVFVVQIQDVTIETEACDGVSDPGSDIQGIELLDDGGNSLGWGSIVAENVILDGNDEANFDIVDGSPPALDADGCVDSFSGNVLTLGCGGYIAVEFDDGTGTPVPLADGQTIFVYEYGGICSTGTTDDSWTVSVCTDTAGVNDDDVSSCATVLGTGAGVGSVNVAL